MSILEALDALKVELLLMHPQVTEKTKSNSDAMRWELIKRIETVCSMIIDNIASDEFPVLEAVDRTNCNNYYFDGR